MATDTGSSGDGSGTPTNGSTPLTPVVITYDNRNITFVAGDTSKAGIYPFEEEIDDFAVRDAGINFVVSTKRPPSRPANKAPVVNYRNRLRLTVPVLEYSVNGALITHIPGQQLPQGAIQTNRVVRSATVEVTLIALPGSTRAERAATLDVCLQLLSLLPVKISLFDAAPLKAGD